MAKTFDEGLTQDFIRFKASDPLVSYTHNYALFHYIGNVTGKSVLDIGCGNGHYSRLAKERGASHVLGVDISQPMIDAANREEGKNPLGIEYRLGDAKVSVVYGQFDIVFANAILIFMETPEELQKMVQVIYDNLKPQGKLIALQPNGFSDGWYENAEKYGRKCTKVRDLPYGTVAKITCNVGQKLLEVLHHYLNLSTYEEVFKNVGFTSFHARKAVLNDEAFEKFPKDYWKQYLDNPYLVVLEATK